MQNLKCLTAKQIQELDRIAIEEMGIPSAVLMENAGKAVTKEILRLLKNVKDATICVICGSGNNGGDGLVVARLLTEAGVKTKIFLLTDPLGLKADPAIQYKAVEKLKIPVRLVTFFDKTALEEISNAFLVVDAIFGVGLNREIRESLVGIIETLNTTAKKIISVDIPSGLDTTTGKIYGVCIKASVTVTFSFMKKGFLEKDGPKCCGKVVVADIGIPKICIKRITA